MTPSLPPFRGATSDRALMGGEAAPLGQPWRASHRGGHDDAKALFQAHRHVIRIGSGIVTVTIAGVNREGLTRSTPPQWPHANSLPLQHGISAASSGRSDGVEG